SIRSPPLRHAAGVDLGVGYDDPWAVPALLPSAQPHDRPAGRSLDRRSLTMIAFLLWLLIWLVLWQAPLALLSWIACFLVSLPLRRQERARFFLDLLELGLKEGHTPEQTIVAVSRSRDPSMGARFHLLAAHLETGLRLGQALDRVPRLLPLQTAAMLRSGE